MNEFKNWFESKTLWMALVAIAPILSKYLGFDVGETLQDFITIVGIIGAMWFRISATKSLKL
jgi:hypothetical protein